MSLNWFASRAVVLGEVRDGMSEWAYLGVEVFLRYVWGRCRVRPLAFVGILFFAVFDYLIVPLG